MALAERACGDACVQVYVLLGRVELRCQSCRPRNVLCAAAHSLPPCPAIHAYSSRLSFSLCARILACLVHLINFHHLPSFLPSFCLVPPSMACTIVIVVKGSNIQYSELFSEWVIVRVIHETARERERERERQSIRLAYTWRLVRRVSWPS